MIRTRFAALPFVLGLLSILLFALKDEVCCGVSGINPEDPVLENGHQQTYNLAFTP